LRGSADRYSDEPGGRIYQPYLRPRDVQAIRLAGRAKARRDGSPTILVVDDTPTNLELVASILEAEGFRTLAAGDGPTARGLSRAQQPDLILLDVLMPVKPASKPAPS